MTRTDMGNLIIDVLEEAMEQRKHIISIAEDILYTIDDNLEVDWEKEDDTL